VLCCSTAPVAVSIATCVISLHGRVSAAPAAATGVATVFLCRWCCPPSASSLTRLYLQAIAALPDAQAADMCLAYAELEMKLVGVVGVQ